MGCPWVFLCVQCSGTPSVPCSPDASGDREWETSHHPSPAAPGAAGEGAHTQASWIAHDPRPSCRAPEPRPRLTQRGAGAPISAHSSAVRQALRGCASGGRLTQAQGHRKAAPNPLLRWPQTHLPDATRCRLPPGTGDGGHGEACSLTGHTRDILEDHLRHSQGLIHLPGSLAARIQRHGDTQTFDPVIPLSGVRPEKIIPNKVDVVLRAKLSCSLGNGMADGGGLSWSRPVPPRSRTVGRQSREAGGGGCVGALNHAWGQGCPVGAGGPRCGRAAPESTGHWHRRPGPLPPPSRQPQSRLPAHSTQLAAIFAVLARDNPKSMDCDGAGAGAGTLASSFQLALTSAPSLQQPPNPNPVGAFIPWTVRKRRPQTGQAAFLGARP